MNDRGQRCVLQVSWLAVWRARYMGRHSTGRRKNLTSGMVSSMRATRSMQGLGIAAVSSLVLSIVALVFLSVAVPPPAPMPALAGQELESQPVGPVPAGVEKIQHIVFIVKENRTFDNYFGTFPGADGATSGRICTGQVIPLRHT